MAIAEHNSVAGSVQSLDSSHRSSDKETRMRFAIQFQNEDCSGEPWIERFDVHYVKGIDDINSYATVLLRVRNVNLRHNGKKPVRILMVADSIGDRLLQSLGSLWED